MVRLVYLAAQELLQAGADVGERGNGGLVVIDVAFHFHRGEIGLEDGQDFVGVGEEGDLEGAEGSGAADDVAVKGGVREAPDVVDDDAGRPRLDAAVEVIDVLERERRVLEREVEAALADGPKRFEELMAALASRDGREVVLALDALRAAGRLTREKDGRYALA